ncbi:MAG: class I SAM-dependent methyltransferase [Candidatus Dormibacteraceae bacterium]
MTDWEGWFKRWEAQQGLYLPEREARFGVMIDILDAMVGDSPTVIDLGSGPGSLAQRVADRLPKARVVAVDADPLLLELGRQAVGDRGGRIRWVDADLRDTELARHLGLNGTADAAVSTTALHWLSPEELIRLFGGLTQVLRPGGIFINGDHLTFDHDQSRIQSAVNRVRQKAANQPREPGVETWTEWWASIEADPTLAKLVAERNSRWGGHADYHSPAEATFMSAALLRAGFSEVGNVWQWLDNRVLVAILAPGRSPSI